MTLQEGRTPGAAEATTVANTYLIGAQKAGTTYLATLLDQSPQVCVSNPKEPQFFSTGFAEGFDSYARCFADPDAPVRIDASTTYTFLRPRALMDEPDAPGIAEPVPERIQAVVPEAKFIYILRDPVKRAMSAYRHAMRQEPQPRGPVSLVECLQTRPKLLVSGRYADQIERWQEVFAPERFLFVDFTRLIRETETMLAEVCTFLGVDPVGITPQEAERGKHSAHRTTPAGRLIRQTMDRLPGLTRRAKALLPDGVKRRLVDPLTKAPSEIAFTHEDAAAAFFEEDRARTYALTGIRV